MHQIEVTALILDLQVQGVERIDETQNHRQRCSNLVGNIGHKLLAHALCQFDLGDITGQHQASTSSVGKQLNGQAAP